MTVLAGDLTSPRGEPTDQELVDQAKETLRLLNGLFDLLSERSVQAKLNIKQRFHPDGPSRNNGTTRVEVEAIFHKVLG